MWFKILLPHQHYPLAAMIGKDGKLYFRLVDVGALLGRSKVYEFAKQFNSLVIQGKDVLPAHKQYPIMTQKSKLVTPDVVFNILNAELSSLATSFAISLNAGSALVENPSNLFVESYKTSPVLHVQDSPVPNSILVRLWVQTFTQKVQDMRRMQNGSKPSIQMVYEACLRAERLSLPERPAQRPERMPTPSAEPKTMSPAEPDRLAEPERIPTHPAQRPERIPTPLAEPERIPTSPAEPERPPLVDPSVFMDNVEVTPPLITRCDKGTQTISPYLHVKRLDLGKRRMEQPLAPKRRKQEPSEVSNIVLWVPRNHPLMKLGNNGFIIQPTNVNVDFLLLSTIKAGLRSQSHHFTLSYGTRIEEAEADLGDYITFMMNFRSVLIRLKPSEVIELETICAMNIIDLMMEILPYHDPHDVPWFESFFFFEPADLDSEFMEQEASKGKGAFVQALWTQYAIPKLYGLVYKAWRRYNAQNLTTWTRLAQAELDGCFGQKWPDCVFQVPDSCSICLRTMHWPEKMQCGHAFHLRCLLRHLDLSNTCPLCRTPNPLMAP
ncbi:uncharacterized protein TNCV_1560051 [Trichonephila clavipes]|nr:uncharacterized protein TNCV_1560051 [Trichonephila clavipes]